MDMAVAEIVRRWRPGSGDWSWDDEAAELDSHVCRCCGQPGHYQERLEAFLRDGGRLGQPLCLGSDGRVWDGHHRIVAALRLGIQRLPVEAP